jgi:hypothetical protein
VETILLGALQEDSVGLHQPLMKRHGQAWESEIQEIMKKNYHGKLVLEGRYLGIVTFALFARSSVPDKPCPHLSSLSRIFCLNLLVSLSLGSTSLSRRMLLSALVSRPGMILRVTFSPGCVLQALLSLWTMV